MGTWRAKRSGWAGVGRLEYLRPLPVSLLGAAVMDVSRRVVADPGMAVLVMVPAEERLVEGPCLERPEAIWKSGRSFRVSA
jgi:hypothetical protein